MSASIHPVAQQLREMVGANEFRPSFPSTLMTAAADTIDQLARMHARHLKSIHRYIRDEQVLRAVEQRQRDEIMRLAALIPTPDRKAPTA